MNDDLQKLIDEAGRLHNVDPALISAAIQAESSWNPNAKNAETGATGLGQFIAPTAKSLGVKNPNDPKEAIPAIAKLLAENLDRYGNAEDAVRAYHGGTDKANWGPKTEAHVQKVMSYLNHGNDDELFNKITKSELAPVVTTPEEDALFNQITKTAPEVTQNAPAQSDSLIGNPMQAAQAFGHHLMNLPHGLANLVEQGVASGVNAIAPNSAVAKYIQNIANQDVLAAGQREQNYQANVPTNAASVLGATAGEILPAILTAGESVPAQIGLKTMVNGALTGAGLGLAQPVLSPDNYWSQVGQNTAFGTLLGGSVPAVTPALSKLGGYVSNVAGAATKPFTKTGAESIANDIINRTTGGAPLQSAINEIVPGSKPTLAEVAKNANLSGLQRTIRDINPEPFVQRERENAQSRLDLFGKASESPEALNQAIESRDAAAQSQLDNLWKDKKEVNPQPILNQINAVLEGPGRERSAVKTAMNHLKDKLVDSEGNFKSTDPEYLYESIHKEIGDILSPLAPKELASAKQATKELMKVKNAVAQVIDQGVPTAVDKNGEQLPGFSKYLQDYSASSKDIDAMKLLQGLKITDNYGNITLPKINSKIESIESKAGERGANKAKSVDVEQLNALKNIRQDLQRQGEVGRGRSLGSNTAQNLVTQNMIQAALPGKMGALVGHLPTGTLSGALGTGLGYAAGGPMGAAAGGTVGGLLGKGWQSLMQTKNEAILDQLTNKLLNPETLNLAQKQQALNLMRLANPALIGVGTSNLPRIEILGVPTGQ